YTVLGYYPLFGPNMSLKKKMWEKIRNEICLDPSVVHEDIDIAIHIDEQGGKIEYLPAAIGHSSTRRLTSQPQSFFLEYPHRLIKMLKHHEIAISSLPKLQIPKLQVPRFKSPFQSKNNET
ncbi:hypothetical protein KBD81_02635, partial [Candidatus Woesebacteria bacterium]|nr:hypothetical protein [Candidatus Woesebacteria bacterium]